MTLRTVITLAAALALTVAIGAPSAIASTVHADFNGDNFDDLAIGAPGQPVHGVAGAGAVTVIYGTAAGLSVSAPVAAQRWNRDSSGVAGVPHTGARFGAALAVGDFDGDGVDDLAIGAPRDKVAGAGRAGSVTVLYGGAAGGLTSARSIHLAQNSPGVKNAPEPDDNFGDALAAGDFDGDGHDDLAVGVPGEALGSADNGAVNLIYGTEAGLDGAAGSGKRFMNQDSPFMLDAAAAGDRFATTLAAGDFNNDGKDDLAIGVPFESFGSQRFQGIVQVVYGSSPDGLKLFAPVIQNETIQQGAGGYQGTPDINDQVGRSLAVGDFNGDGFDDLGIGTSDDVGATAFNAGALMVVYGNSSSGLDANAGPGNQLINADSAGVPGTATINETWTQGLAAGDYNGDGADDIAIGNPSEDVGSAFDAGSVVLIYGAPATGIDAANAPAPFELTQDSPGADEIAELADRFGAALGAGDFNNDGRDDLAVGVPSEDQPSVTDSGLAQVFYGDGTNGVRGNTGPGDMLFFAGVAGVPGTARQGDELGQAVSSGKHS